MVSEIIQVEGGSGLRRRGKIERIVVFQRIGRALCWQRQMAGVHIEFHVGFSRAAVIERGAEGFEQFIFCNGSQA